jgi:hypothetical protein
MCSLAACASDRTSSSTDAKQSGGHPIRIQYVHYTSGQKFELIDQSRSSATELYSKTRRLEDASTKVTTDEVLQATLDLFESKGFFDKAEHGASPASGQGVFLQSLEVETPDHWVHMSVQRGSTQPDLKLFTECKQAFIGIYNDTYQLQSVDRAPDWNVQAPSGQSPAKKKIN